MFEIIFDTRHEPARWMLRSGATFDNVPRAIRDLNSSPCVRKALIKIAIDFMATFTRLSIREKIPSVILIS